MMFKLEKYINDLICECKNIFGERLLYVGLQGSYLRKEAHENSDIDIMVIIDDITIHDLNNYRNILMIIGYFEKSCGFICGKEDFCILQKIIMESLKILFHLIHTKMKEIT